MLIYARNQTFCSKSVNKVPKILIFGLNILCGILSNYTWKNVGIKINFLCILLFYEFLMYFFVFFYLFVFVVFSVKFVADTFWSTIMLKQIHLLRNFRTVPPGVKNLVSKCAGTWKKKSHKVSRRELCALQSNRMKCRGGAPPVFLGLNFFFRQYFS